MSYFLPCCTSHCISTTRAAITSVCHILWHPLCFFKKYDKNNGGSLTNPCVTNNPFISTLESTKITKYNKINMWAPLKTPFCRDAQSFAPTFQFEKPQYIQYSCVFQTLICVKIFGHPTKNQFLEVPMSTHLLHFSGENLVMFCTVKAYNQSQRLC